MAGKDKKLVENRYKTLRPPPTAAGRLRLCGVSYLNAQPLLHGLLSGLGEDRMHLELACNPGQQVLASLHAPGRGRLQFGKQCPDRDVILLEQLNGVHASLSFP